MKASSKRVCRFQIPQKLLRTVAFAMIVSAYAAVPTGSAVESPKEIYDTAKSSTFVIETFDGRGIPLSLGTGFAVRSNYLASNCHVIRGAKRVTAKNLSSGHSYPIEAIVGSDFQADLVLLRMGVSAKPLDIDTNLAWSVGDSVYALGNPRGLEGTFSAGIISAARELNNVNYLQITAPISPGSSGGPILSNEGKVIGVATAAMKESQNLNFAVSVKHLVALLTADLQEETLGGFFTKQEAFVRKGDSASPANGTDIVIRNFEWTPTPFDELEDARSFTFSVFNGLSRPLRGVLVVISFLNADFEPIETKFIPITATIATESAVRAKGAVDASVAKLNRLPERDDLSDYKPKTYKLGTNTVSEKWSGSSLRGYKSSYLINGKKATLDDYLKLKKDVRTSMRVMRVLTFEYAD